MSESVKIGGIGKNPAIDRINQLNANRHKKTGGKEDGTAAAGTRAAAGGKVS